MTADDMEEKPPRRIRLVAGLLAATLVFVVMYFVHEYMMGNTMGPNWIELIGGQLTIFLALLAGLFVDRAGLRLKPPQGARWLDAVAIPVIVVAHFIISIVAAVILVQSHLVPTRQLDQSSTEQWLSAVLGGDLRFAILLAVLVATSAGVLEELLFRGYLLTRLMGLGLRPWVSALFGGILFALLHAPGYGFLVSLPKIGFGVLCGLYFVKRQRLWPVMTVHFITDLVGLLAMIAILHGRLR